VQSADMFCVRVGWTWLLPAAGRRHKGRHGRGQHLRQGRIGGRFTPLVAARRLGPLLNWDLNRDSGEEQLVDVLRGPVVRTENQDHDTVG